MLSKKLVSVLKDSPKISGLILYLSNDTFTSFTHDLQCPNEIFGIPNTCSKDNEKEMWNPYGTGLMFEDIKFPIFYIDDFNEIQTAKDCFQKFNNFSYETQRDRSLCSVQMNSFMYAAKNTPTCVRLVVFTVLNIFKNLKQEFYVKTTNISKKLFFSSLAKTW